VLPQLRLRGLRSLAGRISADGVAILRWDGARLTRIGETSDQAKYVDLNEDGVLEIVEGVRGGRTYVQRLQRGRYVPLHR
jgi:hypothetical protein